MDKALIQRIEERLRALFIRSLAGDTAAYHALLIDLTTHLRGFLRKRLSHLQDDVEDLVQEILLALHNARHTYRPGEPFTAWVHAIARYKLTDYFRARSRRDALNTPLDDELEIFATSDTEAADARRDLSTLLAQLPERQRLPILHVKLQGLSVAETAKLTGLSESAVKIGIHRGLKALAIKVRDAS